MTPALLTAVDSTSHVHLIVGSNPLASARIARSIEVGAIPKLVAPEDAVVHYSPRDVAGYHRLGSSVNALRSQQCATRRFVECPHRAR